VTLTDDIPTDVHDVPIDFDALPPALEIDTSNPDVGSCKTCGTTVHRPPGMSPTGRKLRIPRYCDECKKSPVQKEKRTRRSSNPDIAAGMTDLYTMVGMFILPKDPQLGIAIVGEQRLAQILGQQDGPSQSIAEACGAAWAHVAASNPAVAEFIAPMLKTSVWAELATAHAPVVGHVLAKKPRVKWLQKLKLGRRARAATVTTDEATDA